MTAQRLSAGPGLHLESPYINDGLVVAGVDEVGKGSWAGPLVVGVAVLGSKVVNGEFPDGMRDSKALTERVRERVFDGIGEACSSWSTGWASAQECDELGMSEAQRLACERAFGSLGVSVDVAIVERHSQQFLGKGGGRRIPRPKKLGHRRRFIFWRPALNVTYKQNDP